MELIKFEDLLGKIIIKIEGKKGDEKLVFTLDNGERYHLWHYQNCCESVFLEDICGEIKDLLNSPITIAEETSSNKNPQGIEIPEDQESFTWTFYRIGTVKGFVSIRWYGQSNGYYSESVDFGKCDDANSEPDD